MLVNYALVTVACWDPIRTDLMSRHTKCCNATDGNPLRLHSSPNSSDSQVSIEHTPVDAIKQFSFLDRWNLN